MGRQVDSFPTQHDNLCNPLVYRPFSLRVKCRGRAVYLSTTLRGRRQGGPQKSGRAFAWRPVAFSRRGFFLARACFGWEQGPKRPSTSPKHAARNKTRIKSNRYLVTSAKQAGERQHTIGLIRLILCSHSQRLSCLRPSDGVVCKPIVEPTSGAMLDRFGSPITSALTVRCRGPSLEGLSRGFIGSRP
jgi:hypothetical protein